VWSPQLLKPETNDLLALLVLNLLFLFPREVVVGRDLRIIVAVHLGNLGNLAGLLWSPWRSLKTRARLPQVTFTRDRLSIIRGRRP